ncbi:hypothetical protein BCV72DRAFT_18901 [Rhizopus microsporus var. microsporus]|uniref:Secreted protein n=1 Tax=Rhizopus microsporus var. microsporus TaxID=86635 RepID=A0A1X0QWT2_RHIZD|nr:hypothetical protein BCV72DRAFT_18901 [Rhizopus microsporus var. microsporus]
MLLNLLLLMCKHCLLTLIQRRIQHLIQKTVVLLLAKRTTKAESTRQISISKAPQHEQIIIMSSVHTGKGYSFYFVSVLWYLF